MNISFEYLYRDAANYKNWGEVVFETASDTLDLEDLDKRIRNALIDGEYFVAEVALIPTLYFSGDKSSSDHGWHEFHGITQTEEISPDRINIETLIELLAVSKKKHS